MTFSSDRFLFTVLDTIGFSLAEWAAELKFLMLAYIIMHYIKLFMTTQVCFADENMRLLLAAVWW